MQIDKNTKHTAKLLKARNSIGPSQSPDINPVEHDFQLLTTELNAEIPTKKQQLRVASVKTKHRISSNVTFGDVHGFGALGSH